MATPAATTTPAATPPAPLPDPAAIRSIAASELPETASASALTDAEKALAVAIWNAAADGKYAIGPKLADRNAATAAAARMRRLLNRHVTAQGIAKAERPTFPTKIIADDGGQTWAITRGAPKTPKAAPDAVTPAPEGDAATAAAVVNAGASS